MKTNISKWLLAFAVCVAGVGCTDYLDRTPQGLLTTASPLGSVPELQKYVNQFYEGTFAGQPGGVAGGGIAFDDQNSDNMAVVNPTTLINGTRALSSGVSPNYTKIRAVNYLLENIANTKGPRADIDVCLGEAYFFRAYYYFNLLTTYGGVTWVNRVLPAVQSEMEIPRDSRLLIADSILSDLDKAIALLPAKSNSATMRVHKDVAATFKSRVALYEGTWQKYHKAKGDKFYSPEVTDLKIQNYLEQARDAAKGVIDGKRWSISIVGGPLFAYQGMFINYDLSTNKEVMLWKKYDVVTAAIGHSITRYMNTGGGEIGVTQSLVDDYLKADGSLFVGAERNAAQAIYGDELDPAVRDARLSQTVAMPGVRLKPLTMGGSAVSNPYMPVVCPIITNGQVVVSWKNPTGFSLLKYIEIDCTFSGTLDGEFKSQAPAIQFRYAETLLNYAEALAELRGAGAQSEIATALKPLRDRVGMPGVDFTREYNTQANYPFRSLEATLQVVRRERRVELACEGFRWNDIARWAVAEDVLTGKRPLGALFVGSTMEAQNTAAGYYKGNVKYDQATGNNLFLSGAKGDALRYIDPYRATLGNAGLGFKPERDYLAPISQTQLTLTGNKWEQNPNWN